MSRRMRAHGVVIASLLAAAALVPRAAFAGEGDEDDEDAKPAQPAPAEPEVRTSPGRVIGPPDDAYLHANLRPTLDLAWLAFQLLPSPQVGFGSIRHIDPAGRASDAVHAAFGLRWQVTPLLYSFGVQRRISPWRSLVVDPIARVSGSIELHATFDYFGGHLDTLILRPGVRATLPLIAHGEQLAFSFGTSTYRYDGFRVAYDAGLWILSGFVGLQATVAPTQDSLRAISTLQIRVMH